MELKFLNNNKRSYRILPHVLFWISYVILYCVLSDFSYKKGFFNTLYDTLMFIPIDIATAYFTMYVLMPNLLYKRKYYKFMFSLAITFIIAIFITQITHYFIYLPLLHPEYAFKRSLWEYNYFYFLVSTCSVGIFAAAIKLTKKWYLDLNLRIQLEKQNLQSELALLRSQINPHFLFNTLNNIDSLIHINPELASSTIIKLSEILRYMLYEANTDKVSLEKEIIYLESLIKLNSIRYQNSDFIKFEFYGDLKNKFISPMLIVPFVENAIKHGAKNITSPGIEIKIEVHENEIIFNIENYINISSFKDKTGGIGLNNVKRRLELLYNNRHSLEIEKSNNKFKVNLILKIND